MTIPKISGELKKVVTTLEELPALHYIEGIKEIQRALRLLDQALYEIEIRGGSSVLNLKEILTDQIDGLLSIFETSESFVNIRVILNGLEQTEGVAADYVINDTTHIQFYRILKTSETLNVEYSST